MSRQQIQNDVNSPRYTAGEKMFKEAIESHWNCSLEKLPIDYRFDYALIKDNQIKAWMELKNRQFYVKDFPDSMINLNKWMKGKELRDSTNIPTILAVRYKDKDLWCILTDDTNMDIRWGARTKNTRDWQDIGPAVHISLTEFKEF
jgi:hypothetical protein